MSEIFTQIQKCRTIVPYLDGNETLANVMDAMPEAMDEPMSQKSCSSYTSWCPESPGGRSDLSDGSSFVSETDTVVRKTWQHTLIKLAQDMNVAQVHAGKDFTALSRHTKDRRA